MLKSILIASLIATWGLAAITGAQIALEFPNPVRDMLLALALAAAIVIALELDPDRS